MDADPDDYFHTLRSKELRRSITQDAASPAPRMPATFVEQSSRNVVSTEQRPADVAVTLPKNTSLLMLYSLLSAPWVAIRVTVVGFVLIALGVSSLSQRALFDATMVPSLLPPVIIVAMTTAKQ